MKRTIIKIDENKCTGCGLCVKGCHEGALQLIDNKARLISELYCDGLGACIGECPEGAIILEEREAEPYDELKTIKRIASKGEKTIVAHLKHLHDHKQHDYLKQAQQWLKENNYSIDLSTIIKKEHMAHQENGCTCPGAKEIDFRDKKIETDTKENTVYSESQLKQWPIQMHLLSPNASFFKKADVVFAADCTAFALGSFHFDFMKDKSIAIACPKLDTNKESYVDKIAALIDEAKINTLTVVMMEVPCCSGLLQIAKLGSARAERKIPIKAIYISIQGNVLSEEWV